jgi:glyoxylase-like metal-dependent hydrolase (beta-lactamase superfamily II)
MSVQSIKRNKIEVHCFTVGPFQENTFVVVHDSQKISIIDPGVSNSHEEMTLKNLIQDCHLPVQQILNTHCHIDHVLGNDFCVQQYKAPLYYSAKDEYNLERAVQMSELWSIPYKPSPLANSYIEEGDSILWGESGVDIWHVPGHCLGHLAFIDHENRCIFSGDVLFYESIGRIDLPGGDADEIEKSIQRLYTLPDDYIIFCGHGQPTSIGHEKIHNPFFKG